MAMEQEGVSACFISFHVEVSDEQRVIATSTSVSVLAEFGGFSVDAVQDSR